MNGESKPSLRPLLFVILFGVLVTSVVTAFRSGFVQVALHWPEDQPSAPLLVALLGVGLALLTVYLIVSGRRGTHRTHEPPMTTGMSRTPTRPSRIGLVAERPRSEERRVGKEGKCRAAETESNTRRRTARRSRR